MGGTKAIFLCSLSLEIWDYCISHYIWLKAVYFRGSENIRADTLSREFSDNHDYFLSPTWFSHLHSFLDFCLDIDLFADRLHHCLPRYVSRLPDPGAEIIDAFSFTWTGNVYLFPPIVLLNRVINKFVTDNCQLGLLIAPYHPTSPVFPLSSIYAFLLLFFYQILQWSESLITAKFLNFGPGLSLPMLLYKGIIFRRYHQFTQSPRRNLNSEIPIILGQICILVY